MFFMLLHNYQFIPGIFLWNKGVFWKVLTHLKTQQNLHQHNTAHNYALTHCPHLGLSPSDNQKANLEFHATLSLGLLLSGLVTGYLHICVKDEVISCKSQCKAILCNLWFLWVKLRPITCEPSCNSFQQFHL